MICVIGLESGGILVNLKGVIPVMGGLVPVHVPTLLAIGAVLGQGQGQGHTLLLQDGEMTTLLPRQDHITHSLLGVCQKDMKKTSGDPILLLVEVAASVMPILMERGHHHLTLTDHLHASGGHPGNPQDHPWGRAQGPLKLLLPAATDEIGASHIAASPTAARPCTLSLASLSE
uniref:Uncharacterized protein n=1 Tax=Triticum urartu TaxID=4572 RepID=A0A8R7Q1N1_TRIUA